MDLKTPVLFITYNRLDTVKQSFECIRKARPAKLYLASDSPIKEDQENRKRVEVVRKWIEEKIDWQCEIHKRYAEEHQGCKYGPANAIEWVFETEETAIIIEDDIVVESSFFEYCQEMLRRYKDDERIMMVSGHKEVWDFTIQSDYFFSCFATTWGWATWKRAWQCFDITMKKWPYYKKQGLLKYVFAAGAVPSLTEQFDKTFDGELDAWDYPWFLSILANSGLVIVPKVNLIANIGFGSESATHTYGESPEFHIESLQGPLQYEENVTRNWKYDLEYERRYYKKNTFKRFVRAWIPKKFLFKWYRWRGVRC